MTISRNIENYLEQNQNMREENKIIGSFNHENDIFILTNEEEKGGGGCNDENACSYIFDCEDDNNNDNNEQPQGPMERAIYWESREASLQEILEQYRLIGSKVREGITRSVEGVRDMGFNNVICECSNGKVGGSSSCAKCFRRRVVQQLCEKRFNASLCTSKWKNTSKMPGGRHEYIQVTASTQGRKKRVPLLIELEFRDEFKMAKSCKQYCKLITLLPQVFIGKSEHLNAIVRLMCDAAKRSTTQQRIYLPPWRKSNFMQMKWSAYNSEKRLLHHNQITLTQLTQQLLFRPPALELAPGAALKVA